MFVGLLKEISAGLLEEITVGFVGFGVFVDGFDGGGGYGLWVWAFEAKVMVGCENDGGFC